MSQDKLMDKVQKVLAWLHPLHEASMPQRWQETAVRLLWKTAAFTSLNMKTTKWCGFETLWFGQHCMHLVESVNQNWLKMFSPICWDLTSVKPNSHRVPHVWFWVSQCQPPTLHTKIAILYKTKLGRWSSLYCTLPSQLKEIGHPTPILRIIVIEEFCNLFEYFLPLVVKIASHASREAWLIWMVEKATTEFHVGTSNHSEFRMGKTLLLGIWHENLRQETIHLISGKCSQCLKAVPCTTSRPYQ